MNGRKAKALRRAVYGDDAVRGQEKWGFIKRLFKSVGETKSFVRMDKRHTYQQIKKSGNVDKIIKGR